jgi:hypothetical protein
VEELIRGNRKFNFNRETIEPLILHVIESRPEPLRVRACPNPYKMDLPRLFPFSESLRLIRSPPPGEELKPEEHQSPPDLAIPFCVRLLVASLCQTPPSLAKTVVRTPGLCRLHR